MQYNVTEEITEALALGVTTEAIEAAGAEFFHDEWIVSNRRKQEAVLQLLADAQAKAPAPGTVAATFAKAGSAWAVRVAAADYREGATATVTTRAGAKKAVTLGAKIGERYGDVIAEFTEQATKRDAHTVVDSPIYGRGCRYADQPGATQYDDGSGRYNVQIWDES